MKPNKGKRSKTGCFTCRRRRVRCDERKPICSACERLNIHCTFDRADAVLDVTTRSRYHVRFVDSPYNRRLPRGSDTQHERQSSVQTESSNAPSPPGETRAMNYPTPQTPPLEDATTTDTTTHAHTGHSSSMIRPLESSFGSSSSTNLQNSIGAFPQSDDLVPDQDFGIVPTFFDLDLNFDLLPAEWTIPITDDPPFNSTIGISQHDGLTQSSRDASDLVPNTIPNAEYPDVLGPLMIPEQNDKVVIGPEDHELIQHYLNVMSKYTKIRHTANDYIYSQIFSNMALFYAPLYNAIMAWTGLHLGQTKSGFRAEQAEERYEEAITLMHSDQDIAKHFEHFLITIWFLLQYELLAAQHVGQFCQHLEYAADLVEAHRRHQKAGGTAPSLGPIGARVLVWLGSYDVRAAYAGSQGRLLQNLETFSDNYDFIGIAFGDEPTEPGTADLKACLRLILDLDMVESRMLQLHRKGGVVPASIWSAIQSDILSIRERTECNPIIAPAVSAVANPSRSLGGKLTTKHFNWLLLLASFYSVLIGYHRMSPPTTTYSGNSTLSRLVSVEEAAARIIRIALWVNNCRPPSPQNSWVLKTLLEAEVWGTNFRKTRLLLEQVLDKKHKEGKSVVDFLEVMRNTTGVFVI